MGVRTDTRERMVTSAALLLRERGVAGTSVSAVLSHSGSPRGSVGHHFPGGRTELVTEGLQWAGDLVNQTLASARERGDTPEQVFSMLCGIYRRQLIDTAFVAGCPVGAAAQEAFADPALGPVISSIVNEWIGALADLLVDSGRDQAEAENLATLLLSCLEGAIMIARVQNSTGPVDLVEEQLLGLLK